MGVGTQERIIKKEEKDIFGGWIEERGERGGREGGAEGIERIVGGLVMGLEREGEGVVGRDGGEGEGGEGEGEEGGEMRERVVKRLLGALLVRCGGYVVGKRWLGEGGGGREVFFF